MLGRGLAAHSEGRAAHLPGLGEFVCEQLRLTLGGDEDEHLALLVVLCRQHLLQPAGRVSECRGARQQHLLGALLSLGHELELLTHALVGAQLQRANVDAHGIGHVLAGQRAHVHRPRRGEHDCLTVRTHLIDDLQPRVNSRSTGGIDIGCNGGRDIFCGKTTRVTVAEAVSHVTETLAALYAALTLLICGSKPMSNMRSASSGTRISVSHIT